MGGWTRPALRATAVKRAGKGIPEGFPRGAALTVRVATPCPKDQGTEKAPARRAIAWRRESIMGERPSLEQIELDSCEARRHDLPRERPEDAELRRWPPGSCPIASAPVCID